jgi:hypothetical protein
MTPPYKFVQRQALDEPTSTICPTAAPVRSPGVPTIPAGDTARHTGAVATKGWTR